MKKITVFLLALSLMLIGVPALAETSTSGVSYSGTVAYHATRSVIAPFGGTLRDFTLNAGDAIKAGDALFTLSTTKVYAPFDGTVHGVQAQPGDEAATVTDRYSALLYMEPAGKYTVSTSTANAYKSDSNNNINRYLNEGETVYLRSSDDNDRTGLGVITTVDGRNFTVEVKEGNLIMEDTVSIYRDAAYSNAERIASYAKVQRAASTAITAEGSVLKCMVTEGQSVKRGDLLLETVTGTLTGLQGVSDTVAASADGTIVSITKTSGTAVNQNDVLATYYTQDDLWVQFAVDESDLDTIEAGAKVKVTFDALSARDALEGTVVSVASIPGETGGSSKYTAYVQLSDTATLRDGMTVSVYLK